MNRLGGFAVRKRFLRWEAIHTTSYCHGAIGVYWNLSPRVARSFTAKGLERKLVEIRKLEAL